MKALRTAFFGRTCAALSAAGLTRVFQYQQIEVVSVTCGRREEDQKCAGALQEIARKHATPTMTLEQVRGKFPMLDLVISFSNPVIFPKSFLESVRFGCVNLHPAPLPQYRGCHSIEHALINGDTHFGATLHFCDEKIDTGQIIESRLFAMGEHDVATDIWHKVDEVALKLLETHIPRIIAAAERGDRIPSTPQDHSKANYYADDSISGSEADPTWPFEKIVRFVRAMQHPNREPAFFVAQDKRIGLRYNRGDLIIDFIA